jgi:hypothetical protein
VFGLDAQDYHPVACGPYGVPVPVVFTGAVAGARDASFDEAGVHGLVVVGTNATILPVIQTAPDTFALDPARMGGLTALQTTGNLRTAHITAAPNHLIPSGLLDPKIAADMFGAVRPTAGNDLEVDHFNFSTATKVWSFAEGTTVDAVQDVSVYPGNELELATDAPTLFTRYLCVVRVDAALTHTVDVDQRLPADANWHLQKVGTDPATLAINGVHSVQQAVIALGTLPTATVEAHPLTLIYSAVPLGAPAGTPAHLFVSAHTANGFPVGTQVGVEIEDGELVEPWVNTSCTILWFRRGDTVYRADSL